eukprot:COSAG06_NODE_67691_length_251_cov_0.684211_1_plen_29_part_10
MSRLTFLEDGAVSSGGKCTGTFFVSTKDP